MKRLGQFFYGVLIGMSLGYAVCCLALTGWICLKTLSLEGAPIPDEPGEQHLPASEME